MRHLGFVLMLVPACALARQSPTLRVAAVEFLGEIAGEPARAAHVLLQDGAIPTPIAGGTLWTFGDTFLGTLGADGAPQWAGGHSNTMAFLPAGPHDHPPPLQYALAADGRAAAPLALLPGEDPAKRRLWPLAGVQLGDTVHLFYGLIDVVGEGPFGFAVLGTGLARGAPPFGPFERLPLPPSGTWPVDPSSIVRDGEQLLLFAPRRFHGEQDPRSDLCVARVAAAAIADPNAYSFFAGLDDDGGARWARDAASAVPAARDVAGQASVAWNAHLGGYLLATSCELARPRTVRLRFAHRPFGPFVDVAVGSALGVPGDGAGDGGRIELAERSGETTQLVYCAMLHPELDRDGGRTITLTCCRMLQRPFALTNPESLRVTFGRD